MRYFPDERRCILGCPRKITKLKFLFSCCFRCPRFSKLFSWFIGSCISRIHKLFASLISYRQGKYSFVVFGSLFRFLAAFKFLLNFRLRAVTLNSFVASLNCSQPNCFSQFYRLDQINFVASNCNSVSSSNADCSKFWELCKQAGHFHH